MQKALFPGYTVGPDAYEDVVNVCPAYGKKAAIIGGKHALAAAEAKIRQAVESAPEYKPGFPEITDCADFTGATQAAAQAAEAGDVVLMSPASAAFDQFKNFMVRGEYYKKLIKEL